MDELITNIKTILPTSSTYIGEYYTAFKATRDAIYLRTPAQRSKAGDDSKHVVFNEICMPDKKICIGLSYYYSNIKFYKSQQFSNRYIFCFVDDIRISIPL